MSPIMIKLILPLVLIGLAHGKQAKSSKNANKMKAYSNLSYTYVEEFKNSILAASIISQPLNYCSFFNNRAPSPQANLKNCTWYKENSCCLQAEIESTFLKVKPLIGSSKVCQLYLNALMCYICAPDQYKFYGQESLTVCRDFCDQMHEACGNSILKGSKIKDIYENGEKFCAGRRYRIGNATTNCFRYNIESLGVSVATTTTPLDHLNPLGILLSVFIMTSAIVI